MNYRSFSLFPGILFKLEIGFTQWRADWTSGAEVAPKWQTRGMHVADDVAADWVLLKMFRPDESRPLDLDLTARMRRRFLIAGKQRRGGVRRWTAMRLTS